MVRTILVMLLLISAAPARACEREMREAWHREEMAELRALMNAPAAPELGEGRIWVEQVWVGPIETPQLGEPEWMDLRARVERLEEAVLMEQIERNTKRIQELADGK